MAPEKWLRAVLADGARPFRYRGGARALLGLPDDTAVEFTFAPRAPRGGFPYVNHWAAPVVSAGDPGWAAADVLDEPPRLSRREPPQPEVEQVTEFPKAPPPGRRDAGGHVELAESPALARHVEPATPRRQPSPVEISVPDGSSPPRPARPTPEPTFVARDARPPVDPARPRASLAASRPGAIVEPAPPTADPATEPGTPPVPRARLVPEAPTPVVEAEPPGVARPVAQPTRPGRAAVPAPEIARVDPPVFSPSEARLSTEPARPVPDAGQPGALRPRDAQATPEPNAVEPAAVPRRGTRAIRPTTTAPAAHPEPGAVARPLRPAARPRPSEPSPPPPVEQPVPRPAPPQVVVQVPAPAPVPPAGVAAFWERRNLGRFVTRVLR
ncbi:hypothetical protein [Amycolatopsis sp. NPDC051128]|uniref:hypothetical protein n=1 Tax=Amycolatopsis sp. NPDC051128 TaxID=3155412 RepID=UPI0034453685